MKASSPFKKLNFNTFATNRLKSWGFTKSERRCYWRWYSGDFDPPDDLVEHFELLRRKLSGDFFTANKAASMFLPS